MAVLCCLSASSLPSPTLCSLFVSELPQYIRSLALLHLRVPIFHCTTLYALAQLYHACLNATTP